MSKVYQCDRCGAIGKIGAKDNKRFCDLSYGVAGEGFYARDIQLCPHCTKKLEDFLSDPNCMETVEEEESKIEQ